MNGPQVILISNNGFFPVGWWYLQCYNVNIINQQVCLHKIGAAPAGKIDNMQYALTNSNII